jgi:isopenicillin-N N-acyltransferase like protein
MGRQHGEQAAGLIGCYLLLIERLTGKPRDVLCRSAMAFWPRIEALGPTFAEEVRGLADGAGITLEEAVLCQVRAEAGKAGMEGCTAFALRGAATADGGVLIGQNQDLEPEYGDVSILLRVLPDDGRPRALIYTFAGQLGYFGMNQHGVTNYANALYDFSWQPGLAHYPLKRLMLEQRCAEDALALYRDHAVCSAANVLTSDASGVIADLEVRPEGASRYAGEHPDAIIHTNHYLSDAFRPLETGSLPDSFSRHRRMTELVKDAWGGITVERLQDFLADHEGDPAGICRHGAGGMHTTSGHTAEPQRGVVHVRRGHGCLGSWETYTV